jgi:autoinducer 2 (AI-2) kinase
MVLDTPIVDPEKRLWGGSHVVPGLFVLESNAGQSGSIYAWYRESFYKDAAEKVKATGGSIYDLMNKEANEAPAGSNSIHSFIGTMVMNAREMNLSPNYISLGMSPFTSPDISCRPALTRSIIESLAHAVNVNTQQILEVIDQQPSYMGVRGGLSNSQLYLEVLASTLQLPVRVPVIKEGTAVGAAICAGVGGGVFSDIKEGVDALAHIETEVQPEEKLSEQYRSLYPRWFKELDSLMKLSTR